MTLAGVITTKEKDVFSLKFSLLQPDLQMWMSIYLSSMYRMLLSEVTFIFVWGQGQPVLGETGVKGLAEGRRIWPGNLPTTTEASRPASDYPSTVGSLLVEASCQHFLCHGEELEEGSPQVCGLSANPVQLCGCDCQWSPIGPETDVKMPTEGWALSHGWLWSNPALVSLICRLFLSLLFDRFNRL